MKTTFFYGLIMALCGILLNYGLYFLGFHDSAEKLRVAQIIGGCGGLVATIVCIVLGCRARRAETPATEAFGYGRSLLTGFLISLWGVIFGTISQVLYISVVNPGFRDIVTQSELAKLEAKGLSGAQLEQAEGMVRMMTGPVAQGIFGFIGGLLICTILCLIIAAFIRRPAVEPGIQST